MSYEPVSCGVCGRWIHVWSPGTAPQLCPDCEARQRAVTEGLAGLGEGLRRIGRAVVERPPVVKHGDGLLRELGIVRKRPLLLEEVIRLRLVGAGVSGVSFFVQQVRNRLGAPLEVSSS